MISGSMKLAQQQSKQIPNPPKEINKEAIKPVQVGPQELPGVQEARKLVESHRKNLVDTLRSTELKIRETRKMQQTRPDLVKSKELPSLEKQQQDLNKQIAFVDSRLKNPKLTLAWAEVLTNYEPPAGEAVKLPKKGIELPLQGKQEKPTPITPNEVLMGETYPQKQLELGTNKLRQLYQVYQDVVYPMGKGNTIRELVVQFTNPGNWVGGYTDLVSNPTKYMDTLVYNHTDILGDENATEQEKVIAAGTLGFNILFGIAGVKGAKLKLKGLTKQQLKDLELQSAKNLLAAEKTPGFNTYLQKLNYSPQILRVYTPQVIQKAKDIVGQAGKAAGKLLPADRLYSGMPFNVDFTPIIDFFKGASKADVALVQKKIGENLPGQVIFPFSTKTGGLPKGAEAKLEAIYREMYKDASKGVDITSPNWSTGNPDLDKFITPAKKAQFAKEFKADNLVENNGIVYYFSKDLRAKIENEVKKDPKWWENIIPKAFKTEKRVTEEIAPSLVPSLELRGANVAEFNRQLKENAKKYIEYTKYFKGNPNEAQMFRDIIFAPDISTARKNLDVLLKDPNLSKEAKKALGDFNSKIKRIETVAQYAPSARGFNPNKSIFDNLVDVSDVENVYGKIYSFDKYAKIDRAKLEKTLDPIAAMFEVDNVLARRQAFTQPYVTRDMVTNFLKNIPNLTPEQKGQVNSLIDAMNSTQEQIRNVAPELDKQLRKISPKFWLGLEKLARTSGAAQIAGNVSTAFSQFIPLAFTVADVGVRNTLKGMMRAITNVKGDKYFAESSFIQNRFTTRAQEDLYKQMRNNYMAVNPNVLDKVRKVWGEGVIDTITKYTISQVDAFTTKSVWSAAYERALKAGINATDAVKQADFVTERIMSDRSPGGLPAVMNTELGKIMFQYGLETLNQPNLIRDFVGNRGGNVGQKAIGGAIAATKYALAAYMLNNGIEYVNNRRPGFDPIGMVDDYLKGKKGTTESQVGLGRAKSATQIKDLGDFMAKLREGAFGRTNIDLATSPSLSFIGSDRPIGKLASYLFQVIANKDITPTQQPEKFQKELLGDLLMSSAAQFVKGGNQALKTINGIRAIYFSYFDPKYTTIEDIPQIKPDDLDRFLASSMGKQLTNAYNSKEKAIGPLKNDVAEAFRAFIFGPKATGTYRTKIYQKQDFENNVKKLEKIRDIYGSEENREPWNNLIKILKEARKIQVIGPQYTIMKDIAENK